MRNSKSYIVDFYLKFSTEIDVFIKNPTNEFFFYIFQ